MIDEESPIEVPGVGQLDAELFLKMTCSPDPRNRCCNIAVTLARSLSLTDSEVTVIGRSLSDHYWSTL